MLYGILKNDAQNTGLDSELSAVFASPLAMRSNQPVFAGDTLSLKRKVSSQQAQRWELEVEMASVRGDVGFLVHSITRGHSKKFGIRVPQIVERPNQLPAGLSLRLGMAYAAGSYRISVSGLGGRQVPLGEFISFAGDTKVYAVVNPGIDGSNVEIYPPLLSNKVITTAIAYGDTVTMYGYYEDNVALGIRFTDGVLSNPGTVTIVEAL